MTSTSSYAPRVFHGWSSTSYTAQQDTQSRKTTTQSRPHHGPPCESNPMLFDTLCVNSQPAHSQTTQQHYFKGGAGKGKRLYGLGIDTHLAILPIQPCLTHETRNRLALEVLRSQHRMSPLRASQALHARHTVPLRRLQLKGRAQWPKGLNPPCSCHYTRPLDPHHHNSPHAAHHHSQVQRDRHRRETTYHTTGLHTSLSRHSGDRHSQPRSRTQTRPQHHLYRRSFTSVARGARTSWRAPKRLSQGTTWTAAFGATSADAACSCGYGRAHVG